MAWAAAIGAGSGMLGSIIGSVSSANEAKKQRRFVREMRATAYQATMDDMRAAGLNPILAYKTGPTPAGSAAMGQTPDFGQAMASGVNAARGASKTGREKKLLTRKSHTERSRELLNTQQSELVGEQREQVRANVRETNARSSMIEADLPRAQAVEAMDSTKAGALMNQATTAAGRVTGATGGLIKGSITKSNSQILRGRIPK